jgi:hypothetical protein
MEQVGSMTESKSVIEEVFLINLNTQQSSDAGTSYVSEAGE